jgi:hypothetical protein
MQLKKLFCHFIRASITLLNTTVLACTYAMLLLFDMLLSHLLGNIMKRLCEMPDIVGCDTSNGDSAILGEVDVVLSLESLNLFRCDAEESEHACVAAKGISTCFIMSSSMIRDNAMKKLTNLVCDMVPVKLASAILNKQILESSPHSDDSISHLLDFTQPLLVELLISKDRPCDTSSMNRWVRIQRSN